VEPTNRYPAFASPFLALGLGANRNNNHIQETEQHDMNCY
jgi:hypothetical protein